MVVKDRLFGQLVPEQFLISDPGGEAGNTGSICLGTEAQASSGASPLSYHNPRAAEYLDMNSTQSVGSFLYGEWMREKNLVGTGMWFHEDAERTTAKIAASRVEIPNVQATRG